MHRAAQTLARARSLVDQADAAVRRQVAIAQSVATRVRYEVSGACFAADDALRHVLAGSGGTVDVADQIARQSAQVQRAADIYVETEAHVGHQVSLVDRTGRGISDVVGTGVWAARWVTAVGWGLVSAPLYTVPGLERFGVAGAVHGVSGRAAPEGAPPTTGYLNRDGTELWLGAMDAWSPVGTTHTPYDTAVLQLALASAVLGALMGAPAEGTVVPRVDPRCLAAPRGVEDLFRGLAQTHSAHDGAVGIQTLTQPDGSQAYIVQVPGTQEWSPGASNPLSGEGNLWAVARQSAPDPVVQTTAAVEHTVAAMRAAGIPPDAPVMLTGYSQGGMVATAIAGSVAMRQEFSITHVATAGSPGGSYTRPESVDYLHVEDRGDVVPGLEGAGNPDLPHVTTVTGDARSSTDAGVAANARTLAGVHGLSTYADTAALVDAHPSASVQHYLDSADAFVGASVPTEYVEYVPPSPGIDPRPAAGGGGS
jgi:hypothetical protein